MRVLHLFKTYLPETVGGIEQVIFQICQSGIAHGIQGEVLTLSAEDGPSELMVAFCRPMRKQSSGTVVTGPPSANSQALRGSEAANVVSARNARKHRYASAAGASNAVSMNRPTRASAASGTSPTRRAAIAWVTRSPTRCCPRQCADATRC